MVLTESLDRISRDQEDIAGVYKRLRFAGVKMHTLSEGEITELHIGFTGTMSALYLKSLGEKTWRGQSGRVRAGKSGGGNGYGYDVVRGPNNASEARARRSLYQRKGSRDRLLRLQRVRGREIAQGDRPRAEPEKRARPCRQGLGTVHDQRQLAARHRHPEQRAVCRPSGLESAGLCQEPQYRKARLAPNNKSALIIKDVPELRIIDQDLWERVKERQRGLRKLPSFHEKQRPRMLLSYLLKCGCCGGGFSKVSQNHYGCSTARNKGTCHNRLTVRQDTLEGLVIGALQSRLMDPTLLAEFCDEYTRHLNRLRTEKNSSLVAARGELAQLTKQRENIIQAIKDGVPATEVKDDLARIVTRREELEALLAGTKEEPVLLHPNMGAEYRKHVANLAQVLNREENRGEAADILRSLVDRIELRPNQQGKLEIDLYGDLAGILTLAGKKAKPLDETDLSVQQVKVVAGVGFEPTTFRL